MTPSSPPVAARREIEPTHPCIRCGREGVPMDAGLCELCNPLDLSQPSATQMHGIAAFGIIAFIVVLAVAGRASRAGVGPFAGQLGQVTPAAEGLAVTLTVRNEGSSASATTCTVLPAKPRIGETAQLVQTPLVPAGESIQFTTVVTKFGSAPIELVADCTSQ
jgi:hypothetical protein